MQNSDRAEMNDIIDFLNAQCDEDERLARAATQGVCEGRWWAVEDRHYDDGLIRLVKTQAPFEDPDPTYWLPADHVVYAPEMGPEPEDEANLRHIARHDPARVLADVEVIRQVINDYRVADGAILRADNIDYDDPGWRGIRAGRDAFKSVLRAYAKAAGFEPVRYS